MPRDSRRRSGGRGGGRENMVMAEPLKIFFAGTPQIAAVHLQALLDSELCRVVGVCARPDRPTGRGQRLRPSPVKALAEQAGLPLVQPDTWDAAVCSSIAARGPDLMAVVAYGMLLPPDALAIPRLGCINVHASLLPRWRGAAPIPRAIAAGDRETGLSIMLLDREFDTGDILYQERWPIGEEDTAGSLEQKLAEQGPPALIQVLGQLREGTARKFPQAEALSCTAPKISKEETFLDWQQEAAVLARLARALHPAPSARGILNGQTVKILRVRAVPAAGEGIAPPGTILEAAPEGISVACKSGCLKLLDLQLPGGRPLSARSLLNGFPGRFASGMRFAAAP